jgi:hypothetical protein
VSLDLTKRSECGHRVIRIVSFERHSSGDYKYAIYEYVYEHQTSRAAYGLNREEAVFLANRWVLDPLPAPMVTFSLLPL